MSIQTEDDLPPGILYGSIQAGGDMLFGIVHYDQLQVGVGISKSPYCFPCSIAGHPIRDDHFEVGAWKSLRVNGLQQFTYGGLFIVTGDDYGD
jgi:hypothetical protein